MLLNHESTRLDLEPLGRDIVRIFTWLAPLGVGYLLVVGLVGGSRSTLVSAIAPAVVWATLLSMRITGRTRPDLLLAVSAVVVAVVHRLVEREATRLPAGITLVVLGTIWMLFVSCRRPVWAAAYAVFLLATGVWWVGLLPEGWVAGFTMSATFGLGAFALVRVADAAREARLTSRILRSALERVPVPLLEEDWTAVTRWLAGLRSGGMTDLAGHFDRRPDLVDEAMSRVRVTYGNDAARRLLGLSSPGGSGRVWAHAVTDENRGAYRDRLLALWAGRKTLETEVETRVGAGERAWLRFHWLVPAETAEPDRAVLAAMFDITGLMQSQAELEELNRAKDRFIATVSHELRTPLTAVLGLASTLASDPALSGDEQAELLDLVVRQSREMSYIVEDLLVAARADIGAVSVRADTFDPAPVVQAVVRELGAALPVSVEEPGIRVVGDEVRLRQIVRNLVTNSIRHGGVNRSLSVRTEGSQVVIDVADDGPGVPEADQSRIFEPYVSLAAPAAVTAAMGLGLFVSRRLARLMGGDLGYVRDGGESRFSLRLPLEPSLAPAAAVRS
jgi:signal transduction histidine kinase